MAREEALAFNASWKLPSVLTFQLKDLNNHIDHSWKDKLDASLLYHDMKYVIAYHFKAHMTNVCPDRTYPTRHIEPWTKAQKR